MVYYSLCLLLSAKKVFFFFFFCSANFELIWDSRFDFSFLFVCSIALVWLLIKGFAFPKILSFVNMIYIE